MGFALCVWLQLGRFVVYIAVSEFFVLLFLFALRSGAGLVSACCCVGCVFEQELWFADFVGAASAGVLVSAHPSRSRP